MIFINQLKSSRHALFFALALGIVMLSIQLYLNEGPRLWNDSCQYLSTAQNTCAGQWLKTSLVHFDEHFYTKEMPAPQTVWPPAYALAIAALMKMGLTSELAGIVISAFSFLMLLPLLCIACHLVRMQSGLQWLVLCLLATNATSVDFGASIMSDAMFSFVVVLSLVCFLQGEVANQNSSRSWHYIALGAFFAGVSCWVRYAGAFYIIAVGIYYLGRLCFGRTLYYARQCSLVVVIVALLVLPVFVRNLIYSGGLLGGPAKSPDVSLSVALGIVAKSFIHLVFGGDTTKAFFVDHKLATVMAGCAIGVGLVALVVHLSKNRIHIFQREGVSLLVLPLVSVSIYVVGLCYCTMYTPIDTSPRMFLLLLPVMFFLLGFLFPEGCVSVFPASVRHLGMVLCIVVFFGYAVCNFTSLINQAHRLGLQVDETTCLDERLTNGESLRQWIRLHVPSGGCIVANNGQTLGYALGYSTISLCSQQYSNLSWNEERMRKLSSDYGASVFVFCPELGDGPALRKESTFLASIAKGNMPEWLRLSVETKSCKVFQLRE